MQGVEQQTPQPVPVQVYHSEKRVMVAAPLPGLEPTDITVTIRRDSVAIRGDYRGPLKEDPALFGDDPTALLVGEWTAGPYYREITLPPCGQWRAGKCDLRKWRAGPRDAKAGARRSQLRRRVPARRR